jgi:hypothetical protein
MSFQCLIDMKYRSTKRKKKKEEEKKGGNTPLHDFYTKFSVKKKNKEKHKSRSLKAF